MAAPTTRLKSTLELLLALDPATESPDPFPIPVLERLADLVGAHTAGYCESPRGGGWNGYELVTRPAPPGLREELEEWGLQDPTNHVSHSETTTPIAISDFLGWREFRRLEIYARICRPNRVADSLRIYLPPTQTTAPFFFFDKERRGFTARDRDLLTLLRPHLALQRERWSRRHANPEVISRLTRREAEILTAVATGATNREIAHSLSISPHTVRVHLERIYEKLGVHTRTAAAGFIRRADVHRRRPS